MYGGGYPLSSTTKVVGAIALVLILVLGGSTIYLLLNRSGNDDKGDKGDKGGDSCVFEKGEIARLKGKLKNDGGFLTKKTGFFGVQIWVFIVAASVVAFLFFQAYFGPAASRGIRQAAGYVGRKVSNLTPSALRKTFGSSRKRISSVQPGVRRMRRIRFRLRFRLMG